VQNSGEGPIRREDFDGAVEVRFGSANLLHASIASADPPELAGRVRSSFAAVANAFTIAPMLWNSKDSADLTVVTEKPVALDEVTVDARIAEGKVRVVDEQRTTDRQRARRQQRLLFLAMIYASAFTVALYVFWVYFYHYR
jgi:hypothetical protein